MNVLVTPRLLKFLTHQGFKYCFSRTTTPREDRDNVLITLAPTRYRPNVRRLPKAYDTYFKLSEEPKQLAEGVDDVLVMAQLDQPTLLAYIQYTLGTIKQGGANA